MVKAVSAFVWLCALILPAAADPFEVRLNEPVRQYRNTGWITLREPVTGRVLGVYPFVTGGFGRGSAPWSVYEVGEFIDDGRPRWNIHAPGEKDGDVWDPLLTKNPMRFDIQLHQIRSYLGTLGCIGVVADRKLWQTFVGQVRFLAAWLGVITFKLEAPENELVAVSVFLHGKRGRLRYRHWGTAYHLGKKRAQVGLPGRS